MHELDGGLTGLMFCKHTCNKMEDSKQKSHQRGRLALRWIGKGSLLYTGDGKPQNVKAFALMSTVWVAQSDKYKLDMQTKKRHLPVMDRTPLEPLPIVVVVVGPPRIGKSTLISSLVKTYSRQTLADVKGPVTVVSGGEACEVHAGLLCRGRVGSVPYGVT